MQSASFILFPTLTLCFSFGFRGYVMNEAAENKQLNGLSWCKLQRGEFRSWLPPGAWAELGLHVPAWEFLWSSGSDKVPVSSLALGNLCCFDLSKLVIPSPAMILGAQELFQVVCFHLCSPFSEGFEHVMDNHE